MIREQVEDCMKGCTEFRSAEVKTVAVDEDSELSMVEGFQEYTHKFYGDIHQAQVAV